MAARAWCGRGVSGVLIVSVVAGCATFDRPLTPRTVRERDYVTESRQRVSSSLQATLEGDSLRILVTQQNRCISIRHDEGDVVRPVAHQLTPDAIASGQQAALWSLVLGGLAGAGGILLVRGAPATDTASAINPSPVLGWSLVGIGTVIAATGYFGFTYRRTQWTSEERQPYNHTEVLRSTPCVEPAAPGTRVSIAIGAARYEESLGQGGRLALDLSQDRFHSGILAANAASVSTRDAPAVTVELGEVLARSAQRAFIAAERANSPMAWRMYLHAFPEPEALAFLARGRIAALQTPVEAPRPPIAPQPQPLRHDLDFSQPTPQREVPTATQSMRIRTPLEERTSFRQACHDLALLERFVGENTGPFLGAARCRLLAMQANSRNEVSVARSASDACTSAQQTSVRFPAPIRLEIRRSVQVSRRVLRFLASRLRSVRTAVVHPAEAHTAAVHPPDTRSIANAPHADAGGLLNRARAAVDECEVLTSEATQQERARQGIVYLDHAEQAGADRYEADALRRRLQRYLSH